MEINKDEAIKKISEIIRAEAAKGTSQDEMANLIFEKVVVPLGKEYEHHFAKIAWAYGNYSDGSSN